MTARRSAVVLGGGLAGVGTAFSLARAGWSDVTVVERGSALLTAVLATVAAAGLAATAATLARESARELGARADALCAAYGAQSAFVLGTARAASLGPYLDSRLESVALVRVLRGPGWCVAVARARCGAAVRTLERTVDVGDCAGTAPVTR